MSFIANIIVFVSLFAVITAYVRPTPPRRCDYECTKIDVAACASNKVCIHRFPSQCLLEKYNCLFPKKSFKEVEDCMCNENALPLCSRGDL